ncbi:FAD-binding oxidoreductase [Streptomyces sp. GESEQ-35]|uniref:FAD-binding oxidoreductase n=1 Tax=Streptomyces sp. GESEQ-35 TaxID=2812657 RepID=UPI001B327D3E|nr:FAD-binding oxidoreductase [Streptomyces sp. GESEQ-35]
MCSANAVDELSRRLGERLRADRVHRPGDPAFAGAATLWNGAVTTRPALVVRPRTGAEVATAVSAAQEFGVGLSVRGGGHDWAGRALREGGLVIDLGEMRDVRVEGNTAVMGGGSLAGDVVAAAASHGANVATGTAGVVGMAGLSLGGGYGLLLGTAGLAADNLLGAEVVLADGRLVSTEDDPELLWALRGGGGNFGVVTTMHVRLHPDRGLVGGMVLFPWEEAATVLARYAELTASAPDGLTVLLEMTFVPDVGPCLLAVPVWSGEQRHADAAIADVLRLGTPISSTVGPITQKDLLAQFDQHVPHGMHWDLRTRTIAAPTPGIIDLLISSAEARPGPGAGIGLRQFHGAATRVGADDTAFGLRTGHVVVEISAGRGPDDDASAYRKWAEDVRTSLEPHALPGGYPNFLLPDQDDQVAHAYGSHTARLIAAKQSYDPRHVFTATPLPDRGL